MSTFVLIHGAGDSAFYWHRVAPLLRDRGHEVVAMDLPRSDPEAGLAQYVDVVLDAIGDHTDLVVVGQSLGGFTAGQIPAHREVERLVYVNAMVPRPGETAMEWWSNTDHDVEFGDEVATFLNETPQALIDAAYEHVGPQEGAMDDPFPDAVPAVPTRFVQATADRCFPADWMRGVVQDRLGIEPVVIPGDHCVALSNPDGLVEAITA